MQEHALTIEAEILRGGLNTLAQEMLTTLIRTAYSANIKERQDCSAAVFTAEGELIAQATTIPLHLGSMSGLVAYARNHIGEGAPGKGGLFLSNDPFLGGGTHLPDITLVRPCFLGETLIGFVANIGHHADVGGRVPGGQAADSQSVFEEGLRLPPIWVSEHPFINSPVAQIIATNSRTPEERLGDLGAQLGALEIGERRLQELGNSYGSTPLRTLGKALLDFTERRFRARFAEKAGQEFYWEEQMEDDLSDLPVTVCVRIGFSREHMSIDFTGSSPQLRGAKNVPRAALRATVFSAAKSVLDPEIPPNAGYYRAMQIHAPPGSIVSPIPPAAVGERAMTCQVIADAVIGALSQAYPDRALAGCGPHHGINFAAHDARTGRFVVNHESIAGGMGARATKDGLDAVRVHSSGSPNLPIEALELSYPMRVERYELIRTSGGAGTFRGGLGVRRDIRVLSEEATITLRSCRQVYPARGIAGGEDGARGAFYLNPGAKEESKLPSFVSGLRLKRGDVISIRTPGGGGWGDPKKRDPSAIDSDLREGKESQDDAIGEGSHPSPERGFR